MARATMIMASAAVLMASISSSTAAQVCKLTDIRVASDAFDITGCSSIDLAGQQIGDKGAYSLASALARNDEVEKLYLTRCDLTADGAKAIADVLKDTYLRELYLWKNAIGDEGAAVVAAAMENHPTLEVLYLGYNSITDVGATTVAAQLRHNDVLQTLDLRGNEIGEEGAEAIAGALYHNTALKKIHLFNNNIGTEGAKHIERALTQNKNIHTLHVHDNEIAHTTHSSIMRQVERNQQQSTTPQPRSRAVVVEAPSPPTKSTVDKPEKVVSIEATARTASAPAPQQPYAADANIINNNNNNGDNDNNKVPADDSVVIAASNLSGAADESGSDEERLQEQQQKHSGDGKSDGAPKEKIGLFNRILTAAKSFISRK